LNFIEGAIFLHKGNRVKSVNREAVIWLIGIIIFFVVFVSTMGLANMFKTMMATAHDLILNTVVFIMGVAVLASAFAEILSEFGVVALMNRMLSPIIKPLFDLPGVASLGIITTYLSDNPAIISLASQINFKKYFKKYQLPALTNLGTAFGMGLIVSTFMIAQSKNGDSFIAPVIIGNIGAFIGSIVSVRIMMRYTKKEYGTDEYIFPNMNASYDMLKERKVRSGNAFQRFLEAILDGGKNGVQLSVSIIPGVVIICTLVMMLTNGPSESGVYTGAAYEGIGALTWIGSKLKFILSPIFGFSSPEAIAFPLTSLGSVGAALGLVPKMLSKGLIGKTDIAVFTAMGMCWSGYLSTHVAMMDALDMRKLTPKAIISHTIGGLVAGIAARLIYLAFTWIVGLF
jgi:spore maturation protein SpmA